MPGKLKSFSTASLRRRVCEMFGSSSERQPSRFQFSFRKFSFPGPIFQLDSSVSLARHLLMLFQILVGELVRVTRLAQQLLRYLFLIKQANIVSVSSMVHAAFILNARNIALTDLNPSPPSTGMVPSFLGLSWHDFCMEISGISVPLFDPIVSCLFLPNRGLPVNSLKTF